MILISMGLSFALLLIVHNFLILILLLLLGITSGGGLLHFLTWRGTAPLFNRRGVFKRTTCKLTLSHFGSQFQWSKRKQILTTQRAIREDTVTYHRGPPTFTKEQGHLNWQSLWTSSVQYVVFSSLKPGKCHENEEWISFLFRVVCQFAPINLPIASAFYSNVPVSRKV